MTDHRQNANCRWKKKFTWICLVQVVEKVCDLRCCCFLFVNGGLQLFIVVAVGSRFSSLVVSLLVL